MSSRLRATTPLVAILCLLGAITPAAVGATQVPHETCPAASTADAWDVAQGSEIVDSSGFGAGVGQNMFGAEGASAEQGTAFFADGNPSGFTAFVEWTTPEPVTIRSFYLFAAHDGNSQQRSFTDFRLYAVGDDDSRTLVYEFSPNLPYGAGENGNVLNLCDDIATPIETSHFRAEFDQNGGFNFPGTRVFEFDGYDVGLTAVLPTPTAPPITAAPTATPAPPTAEATDAPVTAPPATTPPATAAPAPTGADGGGSSTTILVIGAVVVLGLLALGLWWRSRRSRGQEPGAS